MNLTLSLASAVILIALFPPFGATWLAPIALSPILIACSRESSWKKRWLNGWAAGVVFWCGMCPWIQFVLEEHGGMGRWGSWGGFALFGLYKGLPMAVFAVLAGFLMNRWWSIPASAALWTGIERLHGYMGFTWLDLGNAGTAMPLPMRLAPVTGVYGISFLFGMLGCAVAVVILRRPRRELAWLAALAVLLILPRAPRRVTTPGNVSGREAGLKQALVVQPNVDTEMTWTRDNLELTEQKLAILSREPGADLIVWPEVPAPFYVDDPRFLAYLQQIARDGEATFLAGVVAYTPARMPLNSAIVIGPSGKVVDRYDKIDLVPFGEFIPPMFEWVNRISGETGDFSPGNRVVVFPVGAESDAGSAGQHKAGAFICYEAAIPDLVREFTHSGAEVLVNLSNDGYFGHSAAHEQHLLIARMRAAENRRWLIRATNDGITASIDPAGRVVARLTPFQRTSGLLPFGYSTNETPYTRYGDWFAWGCLGLGIGLSALGASYAGSQAHRRP
jgi:apolipoprotein N-acyltransferase